MKYSVVDTELLVEIEVVEVEVVADCDSEVSVECFNLLCLFSETKTLRNFYCKYHKNL